MTHRSVVNLSDHILTDDQMRILSKGLKFCPTPGPPDPGETREDMDKLHRRVRQIAFFEDPEYNEDPDNTLGTSSSDTDNLLSLSPFKHRKFKLPSTGRGPPAPNTVEAMVRCNESDFIQRLTPHNKKRQNISPIERRTLAELQKNTQLVIKPADKGGSIVILNRSDYLIEGYKQLSNDDFYLELDTDPTESNRKLIQDTIEDLFQNGEIDISVKEYLTDKHCKTPNFYMLPKIHKGITPPPGRPILSANGSPTEKISQFVDHFLNPLCPKIRSYVKDSTHFLQIMEETNNIPPNSYLVTLDVNSLYTNIPVDQGLSAVKKTLTSNRPDSRCKPTNQSILNLLKLVLTKNNFNFNGKHFLQIKGVSMGSKVSPSLAILYMGDFETLHVYTYHQQPLIYVRYIDDIFMIWPHSLEDLNSFITHLNSQTESIKFSSEISQTKISFLDIQITLQEGQITTDLFCKPTDSHDYLPYDSAHPQRCKDSIPYSQFLRIRRICSTLDLFDKNIIFLGRHFLRRGYPIELLEEAILLARRKDRHTLLHQDHKPETNPDLIFLTTTYHPNDNTLRDIIHKNWPILGTSSTTTHVYKKKLMTGYRRPKNLRDILIRAHIPRLPEDAQYDPKAQSPEPTVLVEPNPTPSIPKPGTQLTMDRFLTAPTRRLDLPTPTQTHTSTPQPKSKGTTFKERGFSFCNNTLCKYCKLLNKTGSITSHHTGTTYNTMKNISCRSSNVIYCITCQTCGKQYVGQTLRKIKDRTYEHLRDIDNLNPEKPLGIHFLRNCQRNPQIEIHILEFIKKPPRSPEALTIRNRVEKRWIHLLRTPAPWGLNLED